MLDIELINSGSQRCVQRPNRLRLWSFGLGLGVQRLLDLSIVDRYRGSFTRSAVWRPINGWRGDEENVSCRRSV